MEWNPATWVSDARQYLIEVRGEFRKLTWPSQREYVGGTAAVIVIVLIVAAVLGVIDLILAQLMRVVLP